MTKSKENILKIVSFRFDAIRVVTSNKPLIHTSSTYSKWNMGEICGLKYHLLYVH